jgi:predicted O-methyltransferase YrrM
MSDNQGYPPGHFYSPVVDVDDVHAIRAVRERLSAPPPTGVMFDPDAIKAMMKRLAVHHSLFPFHKNHDGLDRFYYDNVFFGCHDASVYFSMLLEFRPKRVIEIGSGFSSRLLLDTSERCFEGEIEITLIDPSPGTLDDLRPTARTRMLSCPVQDAPVELFDDLEANDILFVDSSHVGKTGSDVNYYLFQILPRLKPGVIIHIHDIFWPFEYLAEWVLTDKRSWNEAYLLHAFLQYNDAFEILYWNNYAFHFLGADLKEAIPLCLGNEGGSLWLRKKLTV